MIGLQGRYETSHTGVASGVIWVTHWSRLMHIRRLNDQLTPSSVDTNGNDHTQRAIKEWVGSILGEFLVQGLSLILQKPSMSTDVLSDVFTEIWRSMYVMASIFYVMVMSYIILPMIVVYSVNVETPKERKIPFHSKTNNAVWVYYSIFQPVVVLPPVVLEVVPGGIPGISRPLPPGCEISNATWQSVIGGSALQHVLFSCLKKPSHDPLASVCCITFGLLDWR